MSQQNQTLSTSDECFHQKKEQIFQTEVIFKVVQQCSQGIASHLAKIGQQLNTIQQNINKLYSLDKESNMYQSAGKQIASVYKELYVVHQTLNEKVQKTLGTFNQWNIGVADLQKNDLAYLKVKKDFDHYTFKLEKLRNQKNMKLTKQIPETNKEKERFARNKEKLETSRKAYQQNITQSYNQMKKLFEGRFKYFNPFIQDFVSLLEEFYERCSIKIKPIINIQQIFLNDSRNTLSQDNSNEESKNQGENMNQNDQVLEKSTVDNNNDINQSKFSQMGATVGLGSVASRIENKANNLQNSVSQSLNGKRRKSIQIMDSDEEKNVDVQKQNQNQEHYKQKSEDEKMIMLEKQYQDLKIKEREQELAMKKQQLEQQSMMLQQQQSQLQQQQVNQRNYQSMQIQGNNYNNSFQQTPQMNLQSQYQPQYNQSSPGGSGDQYGNFGNFGSNGGGGQKQFQNYNQNNNNNSNDFSKFDDWSGFGNHSPNKMQNKDNQYGQNAFGSNSNNITTFAPPPNNTIIPSNLDDTSYAQSTLFDNFDQSKVNPSNNIFNNPQAQQPKGLDIIQTNTVYVNQPQFQQQSGNNMNNNNNYNNNSNNNNFGGFGNNNNCNSNYQNNNFGNYQSPQQQSQFGNNNNNNFNQSQYQQNQQQQQSQAAKNTNPFMDDLI